MARSARTATAISATPAGWTLIAAFLLSLLPVEACIGKDALAYRDRGNRFEGYQVIEVAGPSFEALSFVRGNSLAATTGTDILNISFFLPRQASVYITARELVPMKHYAMRATKTRWPQGWNTFGPWETAVVIEPLQIPRANIGVLARIERDRQGSGKLAALQIGRHDDTAAPPTYEFQFHTKYDLKKVIYRVSRIDTGATVERGVLYDLFGGTPASIRFQLKNQPEGEFRLLLDCLYKGRSGGPRRNYTFYHIP